MKLAEPYVFDWDRIQHKDGYHIEYSVTDICNRNCACCSHLAPLAKSPNFVTEEEFTRVVKIMRKVVPDAHTFWLTGGEPTLHPRFTGLLGILRNIYPDIYVGIYTNGMTLEKYEYDEEFWKFMRENGIVWGVTGYGRGREYFKELFGRHGCGNNLAYMHDGRLFFNLTNYSRGQPVSREKYEKCGWVRSKINIRGGRIYNCPASEFADLFAGYFGMDLRVTKDDCLVIDDTLTRKRIEDFRGPMPFCANCAAEKRFSRTVRNMPSARDIREWSESEI